MSCFGGRNEQIYIIEILIHKLTLTKSKIKDLGDYPIAVKVQFLDFSVFEITRDEFYSVKPPPPTEDGIFYFMVGRSCLFIKQPKDLVTELQSQNIKVGVFRVGDSYPMAETEITLPGCMCDQVAMALNDPQNLPKPFMVKGSFNLLDPGENPSGTLEMEMRLSCLGRSIMTHYELHPKFFTFRNNGQEREFCVRRLLPPSYYPEGEAKEVTEFLEKTTVDEMKGKVKEEPTKKKKERKGKGRGRGRGRGR
ncbi:uncharacterized protein LOC107997569 [Apis cerana]|uniref:uncharacterized protein LOC107997569 n=1 Tax=Apis cerana TaxID=7461 RepID=UPI0007E2C407|nr:uncharacterized protein LOC107997569 [Apis cerana]